MELFKDTKYDELDDISQLVEPYEFIINEQLSKFPDELELDNSFFKRAVLRNAGSETIYEDLRSVVERAANDRNLNELGDWTRSNYEFSRDFFKYEVGDDVRYNAKTDELTGSAKIVKQKMAYEDKDIDEMLLKHMNKEFRIKLGRPSYVNKSRINEICDLFGVTDALSDRKTSGKVGRLRNKYEELFNNRSLNIRDVDLFSRFIKWNVAYIRDGNLPAMSNITKIKIMMRNELPIYSIKEEEV